MATNQTNDATATRQSKTKARRLCRVTFAGDKYRPSHYGHAHAHSAMPRLAKQLGIEITVTDPDGKITVYKP